MTFVPDTSHYTLAELDIVVFVIHIETYEGTFGYTTNFIYDNQATEEAITSYIAEQYKKYRRATLKTILR